MRSVRNTSEPFDGVAEAWWKDRDDVVMAFGTEEGQPAHEDAIEDERRFIDLPHSSIWFAKEYVIVEV
jgi:hypothetical protein